MMWAWLSTVAGIPVLKTAAYKGDGQMSNAQKKIIVAHVGPIPRDFNDFITMGMPKVTVTYDDSSDEELFSFYPDETMFTPADFVGKTREEALRLRHKRDVAYLQS